MAPRTMLLPGFLPVLCPLGFLLRPPLLEPGPSRDGARGAPRWLSPEFTLLALIPVRPLGVGEVTPRKTFLELEQKSQKNLSAMEFSRNTCAPKVRTWRARVLVRWGSLLARRRQAPARLLAQGPFCSKIELLLARLCDRRRSSGAPAPVGEAAFRQRRHPSSCRSLSSAERRLKVNGDLSLGCVSRYPLQRWRRAGGFPRSLLHPPKLAISPKEIDEAAENRSSSVFLARVLKRPTADVLPLGSKSEPWRPSGQNPSS